MRHPETVLTKCQKSTSHRVRQWLNRAGDGVYSPLYRQRTRHFVESRPGRRRRTRERISARIRSRYAGGG